eukprot:CAMPEP_0118973610 /NCGR_PEP_ID=MMETSP1173-20130426/10568_1 /TAXON_ID=1034831 /ORGANISM="Rhizochromulina marina cf, Strain CCMP1243" /LENGTH=248 /DNA_ID=CAMNT_0006923291 /DNA_START=56 /DNA_END=802 /DNA_ORIENTATION=-
MELEAPLEGMLEEKLRAGDFQAARPIIEEIELRDADAPSTDPRIPIVYAKQLFLYLILNDMHNARHLWRRIDDSCKTDGSELVKVHAVASLLWQRSDIPGAFNLLRGEWSETLKPLATALRDGLQKRQLSLFEKAYTSVTLSTATAALGFTSDADTAAACTAQGWHVDEAGVIRVTKRPAAVKELQGFEQLEMLSHHVTLLERQSVTKIGPPAPATPNPFSSANANPPSSSSSSSSSSAAVASLPSAN